MGHDSLSYRSLSTVNREYGALMSAPYYDLFDEIARPSPVRLPRIPQQQIQKAMQAYKLNEPQATAILGSLDVEGFALIQGYVESHTSNIYGDC